MRKYIEFITEEVQNQETQAQVSEPIEFSKIIDSLKKFWAKEEDGQDEQTPVNENPTKNLDIIALRTRLNTDEEFNKLYQEYKNEWVEKQKQTGNSNTDPGEKTRARFLITANKQLPETPVGAKRRENYQKNYNDLVGTLQTMCKIKPIVAGNIVNNVLKNAGDKAFIYNIKINPDLVRSVMQKSADDHISCDTKSAVKKSVAKTPVNTDSTIKPSEPPVEKPIIKKEQPVPA